MTHPKHVAAYLPHLLIMLSIFSGPAEALPFLAVLHGDHLPGPTFVDMQDGKKRCFPYNKAVAQYNYSLNLMKRDLNDAAIYLFRLAIQAEPQFGPPYIELGCLYIEMGEPRRAREMLDNGLDPAPDSPRGRKRSIKLLAEESSP